MKTRDIILQNTTDILWQKGFYGTGINEIIERSDIPKGSLYHHFPGGKDELVSAALERKAMEFAELYKTAMKGKGSAENGLKAVVDVYIDQANAKNPLYGCHLATVSLDVAMENETMRKTCENLFEFWIDAVDAYLKYKGVSKSRRKAEAFMSLLEGALLMSKVQKSDQPLKSIKDHIKPIIENE